MSKLAPQLKALINASFARPGTVPAPGGIRGVYEGIVEEAVVKGVGMRGWLSLATAATITMNSPESLTELYRVATTTTLSSSKDKKPSPVYTAEFMREVGLKCISFNGIPRTINCLGAFRASLPSDVIKSLSTTSTRTPTPTNIPLIKSQGLTLWKSIYTPHDQKLIQKLSDSHPDLPVHILNSHYGALLSDPPGRDTLAGGDGPPVGRICTSVVGISCLRAQTGVGLQVVSHVWGLRKGIEELEGKGEEVKETRWLASDEGSIWILKSVDAIVEAIGEGVGEGTTFAPGFRAKL